MGLLSVLNKEIYRARVLFKDIPDWLKSLVANGFNMFFINYMGICFTLLTLEK